MEKTNKRIILVLSMFLVLFVILVLYMTYFQSAKAKEIADNEYNKRLWVDENSIRRGTIYDRDGNEVVVTKKDEEGNNYRSFPMGQSYSNITGYHSKIYGTAGLEKSYGKVLLNINEKTPLSELKDLVSTSDMGNSLILTVQSRLQQKAYDLLEGKKGSVVLLNPKTGEIYAMSSRPTFNPNSVTSDWEALVNSENSPLINRATQGQYTPGSVFKLVTSTAILKHKSDLDTTVQDDEGKITIDGYTLSNYKGEAYGETDLKKALVNSSNVYFAKLGTDLGKAVLSEVADKYYIGRSFDFDLPLGKSVNGFEEAKDKAALATTCFGQGSTLVSPLNMAMVMGAIANDGNLMQPYLISQIIDPSGDVKQTTQPQVMEEILEPALAHELMEDLKATADSYQRINIRGIEVVGKSGTAEIKDKESTHSWFVAAAPYDDPKFAVAVILEDDNSSGSVTAAPIANEILEYAINQLGLE
ncbi:MAG: penicillin-binding transpeptidase domain-containing protein [Tissierellia bacterium]|nr:penicillin-binding transpeptidase domain-containing protein [Tissierellia bacterium]